MKIIIAAFLIVVVIAGCSKNNDLKPDNSISINTVTDNPVKLTLDDSIHMAAFSAGPQIVKTSVSGKNLILKLDENVNLFLSATGYKKTSAVHLLEDFKNTLLAGFDYTTVAEGGNTTLNWVDDNLNNVKLISVSDTTINHIKVVKINVSRTFTFFKVYNNNQLAMDEQSILLNKKDDQIMFTSYSYYNQKNYPKTSVVALVDYER